MREHVFKYTGSGLKCMVLIVYRIISDVDEGGEDGFMTITATVNADSMVQYAKSFAPEVIVLEPPEVVEQIKADMYEVLKQYEKMGK